MAPRLLAAILVLAAATAAAADERPKIGLALSGGAARGCAHVGVLKVLEEMRVPVDYVAGVSMGAVVGGLYAAGMTPAEIERTLTRLDWQSVLEDRTAYRELAFRRKEDERRYLMDVEVGVGKQGFTLPAGLLTGQKLGFQLQSFLRPVADVTDFSRLPTPFRAVATDLETGEVVVLARGQLAAALRASMAIPGVFSPIEIDDRLLLDGGVANNLPVDVVRDMGAGVVIAVDVSEPLASREELRSLLGVTNQAISVLTRANMDSRRADADLVIAPDVDEVGTMAFEKTSEIIALGAEAARRHDLAAWSVDEAAYDRYRESRRVPPPSPVRVDFVRIAGNRRVDERVIRHLVDIRPGDLLDLGKVGKDLERIYGLADFEQARYRLVEEDGQTGLVFHVREKPWGPTYLHFGLELASDLEGEASFAALVNLNRTALNRRGGEWRNELRAGEDQGVLTELYQPLDFAGRWFVAPRLAVDTENQSVFEDDRKIAVYEIGGYETGVDVGLRIGHHGELRAGALWGENEADVETGPAELPSFDVARGGWRLRLAVDATDDPAIPRNGLLLEAALFLSRPGLGGDLRYEKLGLKATQFLSRGRHTWILGIEGGSGLGSEVPFFDQFRVGGLLSLGGYAEGQFRGPVYGVGRLGYTYRLLGSTPGLGSVYGGAVLEAGNVWPDNSADFGDLRPAITLLVATETFFGPAFVGYGLAEDGANRFYLTLGRTF